LGFTHGLDVKDVFLFSFVDEDGVLELFDDDIPREDRFGSSHQSSDNYISGENVSLSFLSQSLDDWI
jgi:hypothetical protein